MKLCGCRFLYFQPMWRQERNRSSVSGAWELSIPRGLNRKNRRKDMKFWPLNPYYKRCDWKTWLEKAFLKLQHLTFKIKKSYLLPKLAEMEWNWIMFAPPMVLSKIFNRSIYIIATWNSQEKIKSTIPHKQNHTSCLVKNGKTVFSKLTQQISLSVQLASN